MIATDKSQSQRLITCGVDPKTADMTLYRFDENRDYLLLSVSWETNRIKNRKITDNTIPAWSLSRMLDFLPKEIHIHGFCCDLFVSRVAYVAWQIAYSGLSDKYENIIPLKAQGGSLIETCVKAVEWLTQNGFKLNINQQ